MKDWIQNRGKIPVSGTSTKHSNSYRVKTIPLNIKIKLQQWNCGIKSNSCNCITGVFRACVRACISNYNRLRPRLHNWLMLLLYWAHSYKDRERVSAKLVGSESGQFVRGWRHVFMCTVVSERYHTQIQL